MNYHCKIIKGDGNERYFWNGGLDWYKENIIIPMFNRQIVVLKLPNFGERVMNMGSILELILYKTKNEIRSTDDKSITQQMKEVSFNDNNCTQEVLNEVKEELASKNTKSIIEKSFTISQDQVFVVMKFGDIELDSAYEGVIEPLIIELGLTPIRVDKIQDAGKISDQILENIANSKIIISDLTGERPNCYYETGFAHALGKEMVLTIRNKEKIHFDLAGHRFIVWKTEADLRKQLKVRLKSTLERITKHNKK